MERKFIEFISNFTTLSVEEEELMLASYPIIQFKKGDFILEEGKQTKDTFLILEGCISKHRTIDGVDRTTGFFTEGEAVAEFESITKNKPTLHSYTAVENSVIAIINSEKEEAFLKKFPRFETFNRMETEKMLGENQEQLSNFITQSPEERYQHLVDHKLELLQRVPQHQIASYIGVTPESLSRIRKRILKK